MGAGALAFPLSVPRLQEDIKYGEKQVAKYEQDRPFYEQSVAAKQAIERTEQKIKQLKKRSAVLQLLLLRIGLAAGSTAQMARGAKLSKRVWPSASCHTAPVSMLRL